MRVVALLAVAVLCSGAGTCSGAPRIELGGLEARGSPAIVGVCSIFVRIENPGDAADVLLGAKVDVPGAITEIHDVRDGKMVRAGKLSVPAGGVLELRPGGLHIMVFRLPREAGAGTELPLRLVFETSGEKLASVRIRG